MTDPVAAIQSQLFPPGGPPPDAIFLYDGATVANGAGFNAWKAWDIRSWINRLTWDLLRFQPITAGKPNPNRTAPYGLRDAVTRIMYQTDQNNRILRAIAAKQGVDLKTILAD
jgi:hypothetical protein